MQRFAWRRFEREEEFAQLAELARAVEQRVLPEARRHADDVAEEDGVGGLLETIADCAIEDGRSADERGRPVRSAVHSATPKRSTLGPSMPAKALATMSCDSESTLTQKTPASTILAWVKLDRLTQTSRRGGCAETDETAVAVSPWRCAPSAVVMTQTDATCCPIAWV